MSENPAVQQLTKNGCLGKTRSTNLFQSRINRFAAFLQIKATEPLSGKEDFVSHSEDTVYFVLCIYTIGADFLHISHTFIKDGVKLSDSTGRWKADCSLLVLLLKVLKPLVWTHT